MDERIEHRPHWMPWAFASLVMVIVAIVAYGAGQYEAAATGATAATDVHRHWGFGGIGWIFVWFWIFGIFRWGMFGWGCGPRSWRYRRYYRRYYDDDYDEWREWHRREHEKTGQPAGPNHVA